MNTFEFLSIACSIVPDRAAVVFEGRRYSYQELSQRVNRLANALASLGVSRGDRVATFQVNSSAVVESYFATAKLDAVFLPLNFRAKAEELAAMLRDAEPTVLMVGERYVGTVKQIVARLPAGVRPVALDRPVRGWPHYPELIANAPDDELYCPSSGDEDTAVLMFTAGTTGAPKGVMLTHQSFSSYILSNVSPPDPEGDEERNLLSVPLHHVAGLQAMLAAIYGGRTIIVMRQFEPEEWMALVHKERANRAMMVPTMLKQLIEHPKFRDYDLTSLKVITYGASPMPIAVIRRALEVFPGVRFINAFGQTETASTITMLPPEDHDVTSGPPELREKRLRRLGSIGKPLDDVEVRIVDEDGNEVPDGQTGEIVARGPRLMKGYWRQEEATRQTIRGGWLYTGDLGYRDEDGYIYLAGRSKDTIKRGGEMIAPDEVEQALMAHPAVDEAAIIGVPDEEWGERVRAIVVLRPSQTATEQELIEHCRARLASFKKPESVVFVDELPRNPMGKVLKRVLKERYGGPIRP